MKFCKTPFKTSSRYFTQMATDFSGQRPETQSGTAVHGGTQAESPDMNPIEVWHKMKHYMRKQVKPTNLDQLSAGITEFWNTRITPEKMEECQKYSVATGSNCMLVL